MSLEDKFFQQDLPRRREVAEKIGELVGTTPYYPTPYVKVPGIGTLTVTGTVKYPFYNLYLDSHKYHDDPDVLELKMKIGKIIDGN